MKKVLLHDELAQIRKTTTTAVTITILTRTMIIMTSYSKRYLKAFATYYWFSEQYE